MVTILWKILRCFLWTIIVLFSLIVVIILAIVCIELYTHIERKNTYNSHIEIEKLIGYVIPPFDVLDYEEKNVNNHLVQGYTMKKTISFKEINHQKGPNAIRHTLYTKGITDDIMDKYLINYDDDYLFDNALL